MVQQRDTAKAKRPAGRSTGAAGSAATGKSRAGAASQLGEVEALRTRVADLERQLKAAQSRVADLEQIRAQALNRIDWAIDSLHNVLEGDV